MLRVMAFVLASGAPGMALADPFPQAATGAEVRGDDGTVIGRVANVQRDSHGRIVSASSPGLEPADAPRAVVVARDDERADAAIPFRRAERDRAARPTALLRPSSAETPTLRLLD